MITPLGQRQVFQTAHAEALRQAVEVIEQAQREATRQKVAADRFAEGADEVHEVSHSDRIRTEERKGGNPHHHGGQESSGEAEEDHPAPDAEAHLDLLA